MKEHELPDGLSQPALRALLGANIYTLKDVSRHTVAELLKLHGLGPKTIRTLEPALHAKGLDFVPSNKVENKDC